MIIGNIRLWAFNAIVFAVSVYLLNHYVPTDLGLWVVILFFAAAVLLFSLLKTYLSMAGALSLESAVIIIYVLSYGFSAVWVVAIAMLGFTLFTKQSLQDSILIIGGQALVVWVAGFLFVVAGGNFGALDLRADYLPVLSFVAGYLILVSAFKAIYRTIAADKPVEVLITVPDDSLTLTVAVLTGIVGTIVLQSSGLPGIIMILFLLAAIWKIFKDYHYSEQKYLKTVETFLNVSENKIPHLRGHSERVVKFCQILLKHLRVTRDERITIEYAALLHDIGKLGMPEKLLKLRNYLTSEEMQQLQAHAEIGRNLIQQIHGLSNVAELIYCHHERYNGTGYPRQLAGQDIPFGARVIAIADRFDNFMFRDGLKLEQACTELKNIAGTELDPELVETFLQALMSDKKVIILDDDRLTERLESGAKDVIEQLRYYLDKSWVLESLRMNYVALYEDGQIKNLGREEVPDSIKSYLLDYLKEGIDRYGKEFIIDSASAKIFETYFIPVSERSCLITVFDMTEILKTEKARDEREINIYRDVIMAVTQGKLLLAAKEEIQTYHDEDKVHYQMELVEPQDVARARALIREALQKAPLPNRRKTQMVLCVSEAATNVIKHVGKGKVFVYLLDHAIRVIIQDNGPGIDISQLPQVTLRKGYSTKISLGYGFTIMLDYLDRLIMSTTGGTTLVLEMVYGIGQSNSSPSRVLEEKVVPGNAS
ncbi:metal dependent phosphohydrolase [Thermincola ferriacetica]|uniref:Metal dependent phosphohydrolase n=1 Tax=Thermincola ferriacetica TaxID=281456 RepID=A0A0L6W3X6_9FIRM|nr:HD domain-containing phosphohydrolase [Thermincola ferriacetica]KNZ70171.1 metal dependent phosphohydrolase [Thermincola ferriacetica]